MKKAGRVGMRSRVIKQDILRLKTPAMQCVQAHILKRDEKEGRKKQARSNKQQGKVTQHTQGSYFSQENELPRVGLVPTTLYTLDRALYH